MSQTDRVYNVLFLCTGNPARSLMAEAILNREGLNREEKGRFRAFSAGSQPSGQPHRLTLDVLSRNGHDIANVRSKSRDEFAGAAAFTLDFVFTACDRAAAEACPLWPGQPTTAHCGMSDPVAATGEECEPARAYVRACGILANRIGLFPSLPLASLGRLALKNRLEQIGAAGMEDRA